MVGNERHRLRLMTELLLQYWKSLCETLFSKMQTRPPLTGFDLHPFSH